MDAAMTHGVTTQLKTARLMQVMADAVRSGDMQRVNSLAAMMRKELTAAQLGVAGQIRVTGIDQTP